MVLIGVFVIDAFQNGGLRAAFSLSGGTIMEGELWRFPTSFLLTSGANPLSFVCDVFIFYFMGRDLESGFNKVSLKRMFVWGLGSAIIVSPFLLYFAPHQFFMLFSCLMAVVWTAFGLKHYNHKMTFQIFFVLPVVLTGKLLLIGMILYFIYLSLGSNYLAVLPVMASALAVYGKLKQPAKVARKKTLKKDEPHKLRKRVSKNEMQQAFKVVTHEELAQVSPEVDAVLDKILESGMDSLTDEERQVLESTKLGDD